MLPIDVIIPVHNQLALTRACLLSVFAARVECPFEVVVVDDASTDPALQDMLASEASAGRLTLLTNATNLGFTRSVNQGMALHPERDVLLLNSDTVVFDGWLDRLHRAARSQARVASVNPLTNSSHIGSYPFRHAVGDVSFEVADDELARMAASANAGQTADVHTTVGFCMWISRAALDEVGLFDALQFPRGYGEESDFCYRTRRLGWRHLIAGDSFVRHWEGQSFGAAKATLMAAMIEVFTRLHPDMPLRDRDFAMRDPVKKLRRALDLARFRRSLADTSTVACREHPAQAGPVLILDRAAETLRFQVTGIDTLATLPLLRLPRDVAALNAALAATGIETLSFDDRSLREWFERRLCARPGELTLSASLADEPAAIPG